MPSASVTISWTQGSEQYTETVTITDGLGVNIEEALTGSANQKIDCAANFKTDLKGIYINCDQDCTIKTNSSSTPDDTIALVANKPMIWYSDMPLTNPFETAEVTALYITPAAAGTFELKSILNPS